MKQPNENNLPVGWVIDTLSGIARIYNGNSINGKVKSSKYMTDCDGFNYIATKDIGYDCTVNYLNGVKIPRSETGFKIAPSKSVLVCSEGGSAGKKSAYITQDICFGNKLYAIINDRGLFCEKYVFYYTRYSAFKNLFMAQMNGIIGGVSVNKFGQISIPLPSVDVQEVIVEKIDEFFSEIDKGIEALQKAKEQLKVYRQAVLKDAFEGKFTECDIDKEQFQNLNLCTDKIFDGPFGSNLKTSDYVDKGVRVIRLENIKNQWFDNSKCSFVDNEKYESINTHTVFPSDVLMSTFIATETKVCQMPECIEYAINKADCIVIRPNKKFMPRYLMYYLSSHMVFEQLSNMVHGATRPRVNTKQIKQIKIPFLNINNQKHIVDAIEERLSVCDKIEQIVNESLHQSESLKQSILKKAFEGKLLKTGDE